MAQIQVTALPDSISAGNVVDNTLVFNTNVEGEVAKITVTSGGPIWFNCLGIASEGLSVSVNEYTLITLGKGRVIHFQQTAVGDTFKIEI